MENYQCFNCRIVVPANRAPGSGGCPSSKGAHNWLNMGRVGSSTYQCMKCGETLQNVRTPPTGGCLQGGHHWKEL